MKKAHIIGEPKIGKNTWIGMFCVIDASGGLEIGENCSIAAGVHIYTHDTVKKRVLKGVREASPTKIGDNCYIGPNSVIRRGVTIGNNCVVGALSYVNKDVPPFTVVAGTPAKKIGIVTENEVIYKKF